MAERTTQEVAAAAGFEDGTSSTTAAGPVAEAPLDTRGYQWSQLAPLMHRRAPGIAFTLARIEAFARLVECTAGLLDLHEVESCADPAERMIALSLRTREGLLCGIAAVAQTIGDDLAELHDLLAADEAAARAGRTTQGGRDA